MSFKYVYINLGNWANMIHELLERTDSSHPLNFLIEQTYSAIPFYHMMSRLVVK